MKEKIIKLVTKTDILGEPVSLRINNETTSKTFIGGLFTIQLVLAITIIFWVFSIDLLNHENPRIAEETQIFFERHKITLNKTTNQLAFGITNDGTVVIDNPSYFQLSAKIIFNQNTGNSNSKIETLHIKKCERDDFPDISEEIFYGISLNFMFCIENFNSTIWGFWDELTISYLEIRLSYCQNKTETKNCTGIDEIKNFITSQSLYFNVFMVNTAINPKNYLNPVTKYIINKYLKLSSSSFKSVEMYIRHQQLQNDDYFMFTSDERNDSSAFDYQENDESEIGEDNILIEYSFYASNKFIIYHRTYQKITNVLADVGGLSSVFLFSLKIICYIFTSVKHDEQILNKIFDFDLEEVEKEFTEKHTNIFLPINATIKHNINYSKISRTKINSLPKVEVRNRRPRPSLIVLQPIETDYEKTIKKILSNKVNKYKLKFSFCEIINMFIFPCLMNKNSRHKLNLYKKSGVVFAEVLDISYIVHKLDEYEKFKIIMMNKEQLALFNFISKDICSMNKDKVNTSVINEIMQFKSNEETLAKVLIQFMEKLSLEYDEAKISEVDKKLFNFLHDEFKKNLLIN